jgi:hypothetical protein
MEKKKTPNYKIIVDVLGDKWEYSGKTIESALSRFDLDWSKIKTKGTITVKYQDKKHTHFYSMPKLRRVFMNKIAKAQAAKNLMMMLDAGKETNLSI